MRRRIGFWIGGGAAILIMVVGAVVLFNKPDVADMIAATSVAEPKVAKPTQPGDKSVSYAPIALPSGVEIELTSVFNYDLTKRLATTPTGPRDFLSDRTGYARFRGNPR